MAPSPSSDVSFSNRMSFIGDINTDYRSKKTGLIVVAGCCCYWMLLLLLGVVVDATGVVVGTSKTLTIINELRHVIFNNMTF